MTSPLDFDLNIENYTLKDVERFFSLKPNQEYKKEDIIEKKYKIREQLLQSGHVNKRLKRDLIDFLDKAEKWIIEQRVILIPAGTVIPKNVRLDNFDVPKSAKPLSREEEITSRPDTQFIYTAPSNYFRGIINPIDKRITTKILAIDTKYRHNYSTTTSTNFQLQLPDRMTKVVSMQLSGIEIPRTYYNISQSYQNNYFFMAVATDTLQKNVFIITDGYYSADQLIQAINTEMLQVGGLFSYIEFGIDPTTRKTTVIVKGLPFTMVDLNFGTDQNGSNSGIPLFQKLGWMLGFTNCLYEGCLNYISNAPIQVNIPYFYLSIDDYNNNVNNGFVSVFQDSVLNTNILARISTCNDNSTFIVNENNHLITQPREYFGPVDIQKMHIRLYDNFGRILNLNNRDFSFCLILKMLYDL